jgi:hypothetical protein
VLLVISLIGAFLTQRARRIHGGSQSTEKIDREYSRVGIAHHLDYRFNMRIEMRIFDVFHLSFGYSVFVGKFIGEDPHNINNWIASLIVDGELYLEDISIGGRMMGVSPDGHCIIFPIYRSSLAASLNIAES